MTKPKMPGLKKDITCEKLISVFKIEAQNIFEFNYHLQLRNFNIRQWFPFFKIAGKFLLHVIHRK